MLVRMHQRNERLLVLEFVRVSVDSDAVAKKIEEEAEKELIIPVPGNATEIVSELTADLVKKMETKDITLAIQTEKANYTIPAKQIQVDSISEQVGKEVSLADIKVKVNISDSTANTAKVVEDTANKNNYQLVVKPIEFTITATTGDKTVEVSKFNAYVERTIAIPDGVDPSKITTGIVLNNDGTFSHVPTTILKIGDKYFAKINSLTNSTYSVIWSPKTFADVEKHWSKASVNNMASRLIINGKSETAFAPNDQITRAEFASILVRALGLKHIESAKPINFKDVQASDWYNNDIQIAIEYGIIKGYDDSTFKGGRTITREEATLMLMRAMKWTKLTSVTDDATTNIVMSNFKDAASISKWAKQAFASAVNNGVVQGGSKVKLNPKTNITRAETAAMVERFLKKAALID